MDEFYTFIIFVLVIHLCLYFFDFFFKTCSFFPYLYFLTNTGLDIQPFKISWFTSAFNRAIQKWGAVRPRLQLAWFSAGVWVTLFLMPVAVILIVHSTCMAIKQYIFEEKVPSGLLVEPVVPGWNLPSSEFGYYLLSLLLCSITHELGHAMAAVREDCHLIGISFTLLVIIPVAMTHLDRLDPLPPMKQLRILCAGVWNNIFMALVAAIVATVLPWMLYPFFDFGIGVQVKHIKPDGGLEGINGLSIGDKITRLNDCPVLDMVSWQDCLVKVSYEPNSGFCIPDFFIKEHDESVPAKHIPNGGVDCCDPSSKSHVCFEYLEVEGEPLLLPQHSCLNARRVLEISTMFCNKASDCPTSLHCFKPSLDNATRLVRIQRTPGKVVLFLGHPKQIYSSIQVSEFIALYSYLPSVIPEVIIKMCTFMTYFSFGIAILNIIPCFYFDGQGIICKFIDWGLEKKIHQSAVRHAISLSITALGTLLLIIYITIMFVTNL